MKKLLAVLLALLVVFSFASCSKDEGTAAETTTSTTSSTSSTATAAKEPVEIYFLNFKPEIADVYTNEVKPAFEAENPGYSLKVVTAASNQYQQTLKSEIAKSNPPVIFQVNGPTGVQENIDNVAPMQDMDFYNLLADKSMAQMLGSDVVAVPYAVEGFGIIYNNAIMEKYFALSDKAVSISSAEEITDFATLKAVVEDMTAHKDELGIQGVFASTSFAPGSEWRWTTHLVNPVLQAEFGDRGSVVASSEFSFAYNENFKQLLDLYLDNSVTPRGLVGSKADADSMAEFALGMCAMVQNGNWAAAQILGQQGVVVEEDDIKFLPLYMGLDGESGKGLNVGTENYFAINKNASEEAKEGADVFLTWLFSSETGKKLVSDKLMFITPFSSFSADEVPNDPLAREVNKWMNSGKPSVDWVFQGIPSEQWKADFGQAMLSYINGGSWDDVVKTAQDAWAREAEIIGR